MAFLRMGIDKHVEILEMQFGRLIGKKDEALREKQSALEKLKQSFE